MRARRKRVRQPAWGIRKRSVLVAVAVVGIALTVGAAVLVALLESALIDTTRSALVIRANDVAVLLQEQDLADAEQTILEDRHVGQQVQVIDSTGNVIITSNWRIGSEPLSDLRPAPGKTATSTLPGIPAFADDDDDDDYLVAARGITLNDKPCVVMVAAPVQVQADTIRTVSEFLLGATPLLLLLVGAAVWVFVGRSLKTVDRIRQQVADIDARRLAQRVDVPATRDEVAALATTMNTMLDRLQESDLSQRSFVSDASHELRSPLATLITTAEVAAADPTGETWTELQDTVLAELKRMRLLIENLLTLARSDAGGLSLRMAEVDLDDVLDAEIQRLRTVGNKTVTTSLQPVRIMGNADRLSQVFRNLFDNAERHAQSTIAISMRLEDRHVLVLVDNNGAPIAAAERERVFERWVRLDESRSRDVGGSGLGLAISAEIVKAHGGSIQTSETPQGWCQFEVSLPVTDW